MNTAKRIPSRLKWTIRKKLLLFGMLLLVIPTRVVGLMSYSTARGATDELIRNNLANSVKLMNQWRDGHAYARRFGWIVRGRCRGVGRVGRRNQAHA